MNLLVDMNLSPSWVPLLEGAGHHARHWSTVGIANASDREVMSWAKEHEYVVFTHDLDYGAILAASGAGGPSVVQIRTEDISPGRAGSLLLEALRRFGGEIEAGALITLDEARSRVRVLPLR